MRRSNPSLNHELFVDAPLTEGRLLTSVSGYSLRESSILASNVCASKKDTRSGEGVKWKMSTAQCNTTS